MSREEAIKYTNILTTAVTGVRSGEIIIGTQNTSQNAVIKIRRGLIPPKSSSLNVIREHPDIWKRFLNQLGLVSFFSSMTTKKREEWIKFHETDKDIDMADLDIDIEVLSLGTQTFLL